MRFPTWRGAPPSDITVYTDGSRDNTGRTGCGGTIEQYGLSAGEFSLSLGSEAEVFDAEAEGAAHGASLAASLSTSRLAPNLNIVLDNQAAVLNLQPGFHSLQAQASARVLEHVRLRWAERHRLPHVPVGQVRVFWTRGHSGLPGNERADHLAKAGCRQPPPDTPPVTTGYVSGSISLGRETTCLAESYNVGGY